METRKIKADKIEIESLDENEVFVSSKTSPVNIQPHLEDHDPAHDDLETSLVVQTAMELHNLGEDPGNISKFVLECAAIIRIRQSTSPINQVVNMEEQFTKSKQVLNLETEKPRQPAEDVNNIIKAESPLSEMSRLTLDTSPSIIAMANEQSPVIYKTSSPPKKNMHQFFNQNEVASSLPETQSRHPETFSSISLRLSKNDEN